jgi:RNA polymerase sigma-70 factor, ECF subfamily
MGNQPNLSLPKPMALGWPEVSPRAAEEAVPELYERMRSPLLAYAYRLIGSSSDAEDLVQTAFLRVFDRLSRNEEIRDLRSWLYRVVHNLAIDEVRKRRKQEWIVESWLAIAASRQRSPSAEDAVVWRQAVEQALARLNERERHCLLLRSEGLTYAEIGEVLGISAKAVSVYLARGLRKVGAGHDDR